jgi:predicted acetyltransferase
MDHLLDNAVDRGEPLVGLTASESGIYRRFGFGVGAWRQVVRLDTARSAYLRPPATGGTIRMADEADAAKVMPVVWDQHRAARAGAVSRTPLWWELAARDRETWRDGATARRIIIHEGAGGPDGYAIYRLKNKWEKGIPANEVHVIEMVSTDPEVAAALWRFLLDTDLVTTAIAIALPDDDPLQLRLVEPRRMRIDAGRDHLWLRLLDVPRSLEARAYESAGAVVLEVVDGSRPSSGGRFQLEASPEGASCVATTASADLTLDVADLSAAYLGGTRIDRLAGAGLIDEHRPGAVAEVSRLFATTAAPFCLQDF